MNEQEYIEGLAKVIDPDAFDVHPTFEGMAKAKQKAQEITDWHREQGLQVIPADHVSMPRNVYDLIVSGKDKPQNCYDVSGQRRRRI